jgi:iron complex outermembrane receptor protein
MNYKKRQYGLFKPTLLPAAILAGMASMTAQTDSSSETYTLDPFTVQGETNGYTATNSISGTRVNMAIKDIPVPITVITKQLMEDFSYERVEDAVVMDATVTRRSRNERNFNENFTIRGFRSSLNLRNRIPYKGFTDSSMIDRIEIVKGPAAVLYGLSDPGGLVNIITKKPLNVKHSSMNFRIGSESNQRVEWDTGGPLDDEGKVLFRFTGSYDQGDHQRAGGWHNQRFFTPAFTFLPTEKTKIDIEYSRQERHHAYIRPRNPFVGNGIAPNDRWQPVSQDYSPLTDKDYTSTEGDAWSIDLTQTFSDNMFLRATVSDTTRFTDMFNLVGCCTNAEDVFTGISNVEINENDNANIYIDFNANFDIGETSHTFLLGLQKDDSDSFGQTYRMNGGSGALRAAMMEAVPGAPGGYPVTPYNVLTDAGKNSDGTAQMNVTRQQAQDLAIQFKANGVGGATANLGTPGFVANESFFIMDQIKAMEGKLNVLAGVRRDSIEQNNLDKISNTSIQAGFTYEVADGLNFYSLYSESFVPNGQRVDTRVDPALVLIFEPSQGEGIDVGFKFDLIEGKLSGSVAYFDIDRTNILQSNPLPSPPDDEPIAFLSGLENSTGYEAQIYYTPTSNTQIVLSYAHNDAKIVDSLIVGAEGLRLDQSAKNAVSITGRHSFADTGFFVGGNWLYREGPIQQFSIVRREWAFQKGYSTANVFAGYNTEIAGRNHTFRINVQNALDGVYYDRTETFALGRRWFLSWGFDL